MRERERKLHALRHFKLGTEPDPFGGFSFVQILLSIGEKYVSLTSLTTWRLLFILRTEVGFLSAVQKKGPYILLRKEKRCGHFLYGDGRFKL